MIELTQNPLSPELISSRLRSDNRGCIVTFTGTVRNSSNDGKKVSALEIIPKDKDAEVRPNEIASDICQKWQLLPEDIAIHRRYGKLKVGEIALVVSIAAPHRSEAFKACEYAVDKIKQGGVTVEKDIYSKMKAIIIK